MKNLTTFQNANQELISNGIETSGVLLFQEGLPSAHYSIQVVSLNIETVYKIAHKHGFIAKLNKLHAQDGSSQIILEII